MNALPTNLWVTWVITAERPGLHPGLQSAAPAGLNTAIPWRQAFSPERGGTHEPGVKPLVLLVSRLARGPV